MSKLADAMHQQKAAYWKQVIIDCRTSDLSAAEYMRRHGIRRDRFYYWLRQIREELLEEHPEYLCQPKPGKGQEPPPSGTGAPILKAVTASKALPAPHAQLPPALAPQEFVAVCPAAPLPRDKITVSCGPFQFELTEATPVPLLQKLAAAWEGMP